MLQILCVHSLSITYMYKAFLEYSIKHLIYNNLLVEELSSLPEILFAILHCHITHLRCCPMQWLWDLYSINAQLQCTQI